MGHGMGNVEGMARDILWGSGVSGFNVTCPGMVGQAVLRECLEKSQAQVGNDVSRLTRYETRLTLAGTYLSFSVPPQPSLTRYLQCSSPCFPRI